MATQHYAIPEANRDSGFLTTDWNASLQKIDAEMWKLFQFRGDLGSSDNLNELAGSGFWRIGGSAPLNVPDSGWIWCFIVQFVYGTVTTQYIIKPSGYGITMREYSGNPQVWTAWKNTTPPTRSGIANYSGLKGGGWADRVNVPITFSSPMPSTAYDVFAIVAGAYADFPFIKCTPDGSANTVNGTSIILTNSSGSSTAVSGSIYWFAVMRH